jgi:hypothetical protein
MDCEKKGGSKFHGMIWVRLMIHICENLVITEGVVIPGILSILVNIQKFPMYFCDRKQRTWCVDSSITLMSQATSLASLVNYSKLLQLKYTKINKFENYSYKNRKKLKMI